MSVQRGDWLTLAPTLSPMSVDLLYVDPPFNTGKTQSTPPRAKHRDARAADAHYADRWPSMQAHADWFAQRLHATLPALAPTACVLVHCDQRCCHHLRLALDEVLGESCFVNHLIWSYGLGGSSPRAFARKHDDILFYSRTPGEHYFNAPRVPATSNRMKGQSKKATDVIAIPSLNNMSKERTGYPTQKPLALLSMLVEACCPTAGLVLDPCCGSGTALVAAKNSGRRCAGFDTSAKAVTLARARLTRGA